MWRTIAIISLIIFASVTNVIAAETQSKQLHELTIQQANKLLNKGEITSVELVNHYLEQIKKYDQSGPKINSVPQINTKALAIAKRLDDERRQGNIRGLLHGIPIVLKDNIDTADGMPNTAGSIALKDNFPTQDAHIVKKLRDAGAIILGKANLSEWANFRGMKSSSGWSGLWGQTRNPYDTSKSTCGSSAGSGAAVSANFSMLAVGTETDGSIVCPSALTGIVGIKPSLGTVSRHGIIPIAHSQDTAGPMARTVTDAVILLSALQSYDKKDPAPVKFSDDLLKHLKTNGLKGKKIGVVRNLMGYDEALDAKFEEALAILKQQGAIIVDNVIMPNMEQAGEHEFTVLLTEFKDEVNKYLLNTKANLTLEKLIAFNKKHKAAELPHFGQELFEYAQDMPPITDKKYLRALKEAKRMMGAEGIDLVLNKHKLDVLVAPTNQPAWKIDWENGDNYKGSSSSPAAISGYPNITVPMGQVDGMPVGISFFGAFLSEGTLIESAYAFEQATHHRKAPLFK